MTTPPAPLLAPPSPPQAPSPFGHPHSPPSAFWTCLCHHLSPTPQQILAAAAATVAVVCMITRAPRFFHGRPPLSSAMAQLCAQLDLPPVQNRNIIRMYSCIMSRVHPDAIFVEAAPIVGHRCVSLRGSSAHLFACVRGCVRRDLEAELEIEAGALPKDGPAAGAALLMSDGSSKVILLPAFCTRRVTCDPAQVGDCIIACDGIFSPVRCELPPSAARLMSLVSRLISQVGVTSSACPPLHPPLLIQTLLARNQNSV